MKLSPDALHCIGGVGDGRIYLDGVIPLPLAHFHAGGWDWITNEVIGGPGAPDETTPWSLWSYHIRTQELKPLDPRSASWFMASGSGRWGVFLATLPQSVSFDAVQSWSGPDRVLFGMSSEGVEIFTNSSHRDVVLRYPDGRESTVPTGILFNVCMDRDVFMWCGVPLELHAIGAPDPQCPSSGGAGAVFTTMWDGSRWIVQYDGALGQLVVYKWRERSHDPLLGFVLSGDAHNFNHDIKQRGDSMLIVATGVNAGETGQRIYEIDFSNAPVRCRENGGEWRPLALTNLDSLPLVVPTFDAIDHDCWIAPSFPDPDCPGTACIVVNQQDYRRDAPAGSSLILAPTALAVATPPRDRLLGIYNEIRSGLTIDLAVQHHTRLFVCQDNPLSYDTAILRQLRAIDVPLLELYLQPSETVAQFLTRAEANVKALLLAWPGAIGFIWQDYTQAWRVPVSRLLEAHAGLIRLANLSKRIQVIAPFAWHRADGCVGEPFISPSGLAFYPSPELAECVRRIAKASPGIPKDLPMNVPDVVVESFSLDELKNGREFVGHDSQNPALGTRARVWVENGGIRMEIAYPGLGPGFVGRTGRFRPVK